ncbi:MAG: iron-sulfur cluster assembly accessory protein [Acidimicrobiia bacterium]
MEQLLTIKTNTPTKPVTLTPSAIDKLRDLLAAEGDEALALRMAVRPGGCSGFSYEMFFDSAFDDDDLVDDFDGVKVVVDPQSADKIKGATLDYKDTLQGAGFHINNPNVTRSCGCGNSFS